MGSSADALRPALEVEDLSVRFGQVAVLEHLSFTVPHGSALAIIGPNGAGKSVLAKALIGTLAFEGNIRWEENTKIGYVPQKLDIERDLPITGADFLDAKAAVAGSSHHIVTTRGDLANAVRRLPVYGGNRGNFGNRGLKSLI